MVVASSAAFGGGSRRPRPKNCKTIFLCCTFVFVFVYAVIGMKSFARIRQKQEEESNTDMAVKQRQSSKLKSTLKATPKLPHKTDLQCSFRNYPKKRYYGLQESKSLQPDFLRNAEYIYGKLPSILPLDTSRLSTSQGKLCVNQTEWIPTNIQPSDKLLPFADGTNPSILALSRVPSLQRQHVSIGATYLATICMTNSQCSWNESDQDKQQYRLSQQTEPDTVQTLLLWLNDDMQTVHQTTILLERDARWGKRNPPKKDKHGMYVEEIQPLDDARLFVHKDSVWISYRDGPSFGYDKQVLNPLHVSSNKVTIKASESVPFCCGRNMALLEQPQTKILQSLTWVDPVTVIDVMAGTRNNNRRLTQEANNATTAYHRRLRQQPRKSHFHGTNAFLVPFGEHEWLGIGHFHRPPGRGPNQFARHGHHYTHAFFTISANQPHRLKRLSAEFVFPSKQYPLDADIIQFASGLELDATNEKVVIAYGINDCEGAIVHVELNVLHAMLKEVNEGEEVLDLLRTT